jgi:hypothetical protein
LIPRSVIAQAFLVLFLKCARVEMVLICDHTERQRLAVSLTLLKKTQTLSRGAFRPT